MEVTDEGILTEVRAVHSWKALSPMEVTDEGDAKATEARELHSRKALPPKVTSDKGILTEVRAVHLKKASAGMFVVEAGIVTCPFASGSIQQNAAALPMKSSRTTASRTQAIF